MEVPDVMGGADVVKIPIKRAKSVDFQFLYSSGKIIIEYTWQM